ncbi:CHRD domain-containing protein [Owenweeksia hongkongensis]|uniref:CHRD domain-containing protein n=1 Tax=Owenweeksia hongkongensis TaxID=253245 RepID=UPI003A93AF51
MKKIYTLMLACLAFTFTATAAHLSGNLLLTAKMTGSQEVPAVTTNAVGLGSFFLNEDMDTLCVNITAINLSGPITGIHVHQGAAGTNGSVVTNLTPFINGNKITATLTGSDLTPAMLKAYLQGNMYLNVHTAANPNGEIRGQITVESDFSYHAALDGAQEVPAVTTNAIGLGTFALSKTSEEMLVEVVVDGLSGPITGAHLHRAPAGMNGGVLINLTPGITDNRISMSVDPTSILGALDSGNIYINIHTAANPNGEIRGQLKLAKSVLYFDAVLDTMQENTPVVAAGNPTGVAWFNLSAGLDTLDYDVLVEDVTATATGAHLHMGTVGNDGPVVLDLTPGINGNHIKGQITGAAITSQVVHDMLSGAFYVNVHTTANANGELRGQVYRLAREGYTANLEGAQEVPAVTTTATGNGIVTIDRNQSNAHYMVVADGLSGNVTGAHFHVAEAGANGPVIFNLTPDFAGTGTSDGAFGYWTDNDMTAFVTQNSVQFRGDSVYFNIHTAANPNGEIRGQAIRGSFCFPESTIGINETESVIEGLSVYPNPSMSNEINIDFVPGSDEVSININDISGKSLMSYTSSAASGNLVINPDLTGGIYLITIEMGNSTETVKYIKR